MEENERDEKRQVFKILIKNETCKILHTFPFPNTSRFHFPLNFDPYHPPIIFPIKYQQKFEKSILKYYYKYPKII